MLYVYGGVPLNSKFSAIWGEWGVSVNIQEVQYTKRDFRQRQATSWSSAALAWRDHPGHLRAAGSGVLSSHYNDFCKCVLYYGFLWVQVDAKSPAFLFTIFFDYLWHLHLYTIVVFGHYFLAVSWGLQTKMKLVVMSRSLQMLTIYFLVYLVTSPSRSRREWSHYASKLGGSPKTSVSPDSWNASSEILRRPKRLDLI